MDERAPFPGPKPLGRGVVVLPGGAVPAGAEGWPLLRIDHEVLAAPAEALAWLDAAWRSRQPTVVELAVPFAELKQPEVDERPVYALDPTFEFPRERLHFLVWANRYDAREAADAPRWHHTTRAVRLGAVAAADTDVVLADGTAVWIDGGPRAVGLDGDIPVVHINQLWAEALRPDRAVAPTDELAADQHAAVAHTGGPARILAPAGSGKTRVLTARLRHLVSDRGWDPGSVTALAYNRRAADEMQARTRDLPQAQIRTLHALGFELLGRANGGRPRVIEERGVRDMLEGLAPVKPRANDDVYAPYLEALAEVRSGLRSPDEVEGDRDDVPGFAGLFDTYRRRLHEMGAIDFDEQVYGAVEVLLRRPDLRQWAQRRCSHLLVDELQDLTPGQLLMIRLLAAPAYDVYGVGDDDQVIYGYAGADPKFLVRYDDYFPGAATFLLEVNYRCPPPVVDAASHLLSYNTLRVPKSIRAGRPEPASPVAPAGVAAQGLLVERHDDTLLGGRLVEVIEGALADGFQPSDIAVLTRVNAGLLAPQVLLGEAGIPVRRAVDERMLDRTGTRAALAWLRLAAAAADGVSAGPGEARLAGSDLATVARRPSRGLSPGILKALGNGEWALSRLGGFAHGLDDNRLRTALVGLYDDLALLGNLARDGATAADLLIVVRDQVGLAGALGRLDDARSAPGGGHVDDLDALVMVARAYNRAQPADPAPAPAPAPEAPSPVESPPIEAPADVPSRIDNVPDDYEMPPSWVDNVPDEDVPPPPWIDDFADDLVPPSEGPASRAVVGFEPWLRKLLRQPRGKTGDQTEGAAPGVTLSTVHRVKGLEWPVVVVWDASEGVMPHRLNQVGRLLEEERRVFHVALTRARDASVVLARASGPSPFLAELTGEAPRRPLVLTDERDRRSSTDRRPAKPKSGSKAESPTLTPEQSKRSDALRDWRRKRAKEDNVPAYVVLNDRHLDGIAQRAPTTLDELAACDGIGPTKLDRYGDDILALLTDL